MGSCAAEPKVVCTMSCGCSHWWHSSHARAIGAGPAAATAALSALSALLLSLWAVGVLDGVLGGVLGVHCPLGTLMEPAPGPSVGAGVRAGGEGLGSVRVGVRFGVGVRVGVGVTRLGPQREQVRRAVVDPDDVAALAAGPRPKVVGHEGADDDARELARARRPRRLRARRAGGRGGRGLAHRPLVRRRRPLRPPGRRLAHRPRGRLCEVAAGHGPIGALHGRLPRRQRWLGRQRRLGRPLLRRLLPRRHRLLPGCCELLELVLLPRLP